MSTLDLFGPGYVLLRFTESDRLDGGDGPKVAIACTATGCGSTLYAWPDENVAARLADHLRIHHGQSS
jgi:hypothetical protein